jgi:sugar lactone lactonase YvrE
MHNQVRTLADGLAFLEGPRWRDDALFASDIFGNKVYRFGLDGRAEELCTVEGRPSGLGWDPEGNLLIASMVDQRVLRLRDGQLETAADLSHLAHGDVNDMVVDAGGGVYVGDFGSRANDGESLRPTRINRIAPDGASARVGQDVVFPNGMVITPDGKTLLVAETYAYRISAFDICADGALGDRRTWAAFAPYPDELTTTEAAIESGHVLPDGICLDSDGALWVGDARGDGATRIAESGLVLERVETPGLTVYAMALGGPSLSTLFMCAAPKLGTWDPTIERRGCLLACEVEVPGPATP